jgi:hypothetical protein
MAIDVRGRAAETPDDGLEALWELPAKPPAPPTAQSRLSALGPALSRLVGYGWPAVMIWIMFFHPATNPAAEEWAYAGWATAGLFVALGIAGVALWAGRRTTALQASVVAGAVGLVLAYECKVAAQHYGNWWAYELVAFGALTAASIAALVARARPHHP